MPMLCNWRVVLCCPVCRWTSGRTPRPSATAPWLACGTPLSADDPQIIFATVSDRDARKLAGQFSEPPAANSSSGVRCKLGVSVQDTRGTELLVQACVGKGQLSTRGRAGGREVVLLQASGSFFAVAPMLRALQSLTALPFSQYLVPTLTQPGGE